MSPALDYNAYIFRKRLQLMSDIFLIKVRREIPCSKNKFKNNRKFYHVSSDLPASFNETSLFKYKKALMFNADWNCARTGAEPFAGSVNNCQARLKTFVAQMRSTYNCSPVSCSWHCSPLPPDLSVRLRLIVSEISIPAFQGSYLECTITANCDWGEPLNGLVWTMQLTMDFSAEICSCSADYSYLSILS